MKNSSKLKKPLITFIIPHRPEEKTDAVIEFIKKSCKKFKWEIICVTGNQPSKQRNIAGFKAKGEYIYFLDNDSILGKNSVNVALSHLIKDPNIAIIGGPSLILSSFFAVGPYIRSRYSMVGEFRKANEYNLILCNMIVRTSVFKKLKGFDEDMYPNEENVFINRVIKEGWKVYYEPSMVVFRSQRKNIFEFIIQLFTYGRGRSEQLIKQPFTFSFLHLLPIFFTIYVLLIPIFFLFFKILLLPLYIYILLNMFVSIAVAIYYKIFLLFPVFMALFFCVHFFYGLGIVTGFLKTLFYFKKNKKKKIFCRIDYVITK